MDQIKLHARTNELKVLHITQNIPSKLLKMNQDMNQKTARIFIQINLLNKTK